MVSQQSQGSNLNHPDLHPGSHLDQQECINQQDLLQECIIKLDLQQDRHQGSHQDLQQECIIKLDLQQDLLQGSNLDLHQGFQLDQMDQGSHLHQKDPGQGSQLDYLVLHHRSHQDHQECITQQDLHQGSHWIIPKENKLI